MGFYRKRKIGAISTRGVESDYVAQYNFCDTTQLQLHGEVAKIPYIFLTNLQIFH